MKTVFTTGEAAKICKVSQQTIIRCFDSGQLKGFRVPGSRFRRIPRDQLFCFMRDNGIPTDALESGKRKVLIVDDDEELVELITDVLDRDGRFEIRTRQQRLRRRHDGQGVPPRPDRAGRDAAGHQRQGSLPAGPQRPQTWTTCKIICISGMVEDDKIGELRAAGANDFMHKPFEVERLVERMCHHLDIEAVHAA